MNIGDRVIVRPDMADGYILPYRRYIAEGRPATLRQFHSPDRAYIVFDAKRGRPYAMDANTEDLLPAPRPVLS